MYVGTPRSSWRTLMWLMELANQTRCDSWTFSCSFASAPTTLTCLMALNQVLTRHLCLFKSDLVTLVGSITSHCLRQEPVLLVRNSCQPYCSGWQKSSLASLVVITNLNKCSWGTYLLFSWLKNQLSQISDFVIHLLQVHLTPLINILLTTVVNCVFWTNCLSDSNKKVLESWFSLRWQECWTSWKITVCGKDLSTAAWTDRHLMRRDRHQSMHTICQAVRSLCLCWVPEQVASESTLPQQTLLFCMTAIGIHKLISKPWYVYYCKPFCGKKILLMVNSTLQDRFLSCRFRFEVFRN